MAASPFVPKSVWVTDTYKWERSKWPEGVYEIEPPYDQPSDAWRSVVELSLSGQSVSNKGDDDWHDEYADQFVEEFDDDIPDGNSDTANDGGHFVERSVWSHMVQAMKFADRHLSQLQFLYQTLEVRLQLHLHLCDCDVAWPD